MCFLLLIISVKWSFINDGAKVLLFFHTRVQKLVKEVQFHPDDEFFMHFLFLEIFYSVEDIDAGGQGVEDLRLTHVRA